VGDIVCPLCEYNLRGLTEPRCPECGYRCTWAELLHPDRYRHPYLFEDHPRRNVVSFIRTFVGSFFPQRFWASLKPSHAPKPRRLALYWVLTTAIVLLGWGAVVADQWVSMQSQFKNPGTHPVANPTYPTVVIMNGPWNQFGNAQGSILAESLLIGLAWPIATFAVLTIFQASMRRAKVRPIHVMRCVVYGYSPAVWIGLLVSALFPLSRDTRYYYGGCFVNVAGLQVRCRDAAILLFATVTGAVAAYHLGCAYGRYLKFDRPWATTVASQVIVWLLVAAVL